MSPNLLEKFRKFLISCRQKADHNHLSVQKASESGRKSYGPAFYISNTTVRRYEEGGMPSPPKLLTLARIYGTPVGEFFRALGASDEEICSCSKKLPQNDEERKLAEDLFWILRKGDQIGIDAVKATIRAALEIPQGKE